MKGINFFGQFWGPLGIPNHTRAFAEALIDNGETNLIPIFQQTGSDSNYGVTKKLKSRIGRPNKDMPALAFWYPNTYSEMLGGFPKNLGYFIFEYDIIPQQFIEEINRLDGICTASRWGCETLKSNGVTVPTYVIPGGVDTSVFNSKNRKLDASIFRFVHIGKVERRKGTEVLIQSFNKAFKGDNKVRLTLFIDNPHIADFRAEDYLQALSYSLEYPITNIDIKHFIPDPSTLYSSYHCAVFPTKAEGIGLPITEAMAAGLPVITTNNTGITEYANDNNSILLKRLFEEPVYDKHFFPTPGVFGHWMAPTIDELVEKLKWVYEHYEDAKKIGENAEVWMKENYTWDIAAKKLLEVL